jgi:hypothetical protein
MRGSFAGLKLQRFGFDLLSQRFERERRVASQKRKRGLSPPIRRAFYRLSDRSLVLVLVMGAFAIHLLCNCLARSRTFSDTWLTTHFSGCFSLLRHGFVMSHFLRDTLVMDEGPASVEIGHDRVPAFSPLRGGAERQSGQPGVIGRQLSPGAPHGVDEQPVGPVL